MCNGINLPNSIHLRNSYSRKGAFALKQNIWIIAIMQEWSFSEFCYFEPGLYCRFSLKGGAISIKFLDLWEWHEISKAFWLHYQSGFSCQVINLEGCLNPNTLFQIKYMLDFYVTLAVYLLF